MQKLLAILFIIIFYSCGENNTTNPSTEPNYHSDDDSFLTELLTINNLEMDSLINRITNDKIENGNEVRIIKLNLSNLNITNIPEGINLLTSLEELDLSNNLLVELPSQICDLFTDVDINIEGNKVVAAKKEI